MGLKLHSIFYYDDLSINIMNILFIHQNFPGQFKHLAPALAADPAHTVVAMTMRNDGVTHWQGVRLVPYYPQRGSTPNIHPWLGDFETKTIRAEACFRLALKLRDEGFNPDVIVAHPGWGESLFLKEVWPKAKLKIYSEFYYHVEGTDIGFDPEFSDEEQAGAEDQFCRVRLKNLNNLLHFETAEAGLSPTEWQASTFPEPFRSKITVIHDGIDTQVIRPNAQVDLTLNTAEGSRILTKADEVVTFVGRNLEPMRGYHIFMRSLPELLRARPNAVILIVGGGEVSYGIKPTQGDSWKNIFAKEVRSDISDADWKRIHFLGKVPYPIFLSLLQLSTVHVYLTYPFVLSWSLLEAMSAGCAIVASDTAPLREAIHHDQTGRLVGFFDPKALAQEVSQLLGDAEARVRLGAQARAFVEANYDLKAVCLPKQIQWVLS